MFKTRQSAREAISSVNQLLGAKLYKAAPVKSEGGWLPQFIGGTLSLSKIVKKKSKKVLHFTNYGGIVFVSYKLPSKI